jgi:UDPglucose 6-dehydrogenase
LIDGVLKVNELQNKVVVTKLKKIYGKLDGLTFAVLGLTYKPGTSTMRRSAALEIINDLVNEGAGVKAFDPRADLSEIKTKMNFLFCSDPYEAVKDTDAMVLVTEWPEFKNLKFDFIKDEMKKPVIIDTKNLFNGQQLTEKGFLYFGIGRGK